jgi:hypothetical protein
MNTRTRALVARMLLALALLAGAAACGGDDEESTDSGSETTETTAADEGDAAEEGDAGEEGEEAAGEGDVEAYCETVLKIETVGEPDIDFEAMSPEEQAAAAKEFANEELVPLTEEIEPLVPEEIREDADILIETIRKLGETGDFSAFEGEEFNAASQRVHEFDLESCGWEQQQVTAVDYEFQGIDDTVPAGPVSFDLTNESDAEAHELVLFRKNDDTTETFEELLQLPQEEAETKVTFIASTFAPPGEEAYVVADLEPGDYGAVCFIPIGATEENREGSGPPHFTQGMFSEFTVE